MDQTKYFGVLYILKNITEKRLEGKVALKFVKGYACLVPVCLSNDE